MKAHHEKRPARVAEPVQVYLDPADASRLERLMQRMQATKSDVLRRGLEALEAGFRREAPRKRGAKLPVYRGRGLQPGVDLDDTSSLLDLMDRG